MPQPPLHWSWIIGIVIIFLSLGILWTTWSKFTTRCGLCTKKYTSQCNLHFETAADLKLNQCHVGLQVDLEGEGVEEKQEGGAVNSTSPTVFSRPGAIIADHPYGKKGSLPHLHAWPTPYIAGRTQEATSNSFDHQPWLLVTT